MLAALLLLGILPLAALPFGDGDGSGSEIDETSSENLVETAEIEVDGTGDDLLQEPDSAIDDGLIHQLDGTPGDFVLDDFEVGADLVELDLSMVEDDLIFDTAQTDAGATVSFSVGPEVTTSLVFPGLTEVPTGDIMLRILDDTGEAMEISLSDVIAQDELEQETAVLDPVDPLTPDEPGPVVGEDTIIDPVDPEAPDPPGGEEVIGPVLDPIDPDAEELGSEGDLALSDLIERDSENTVGMGAALQQAAGFGVDDTALGAGDDALDLGDDGIFDTGVGTLGQSETAPVIFSTAPIGVVDGGPGNDAISTGDAGGYVFGGEGDDTLTAGEGAAALYGGAGSDVLTAGDSAGYLDGGSGNDAITGGVGDDVLEGGEHSDAQSAGDDTIDGGAGDDSIRGGFGADLLRGGSGDDVIDHLGRTEEREIIEQHNFAWHIDDAADSLEGGAGDDTLIFDGSDVASGGEGSDLFWLYTEGDEDVAEVADFQVGQDFLRVSLNPNIGENDEPEVLVQPSEDGADGMVIVNGDLVAILRGAPTATASDIYAEVQGDVFG